MSTLEDVQRLAAVYFDRHQEWPGELRLDAQRLHALAHEVTAGDFQRICLLVRLRARRTPGASAGSRSVIQVSEVVPARPGAVQLAAQWLGVRSPEPTDAVRFEAAFFPRPTAWGLRGDPHLWDALHDRFAGRPMPVDRAELTAVLFHAISEIIGCDIRTAGEMVRVPAFVTGSGMSDGHVNTEFWVQRGVPAIVANAEKLTRA